MSRRTGERLDAGERGAGFEAALANSSTRRVVRNRADCCCAARASAVRARCRACDGYGFLILDDGARPRAARARDGQVLHGDACWRGRRTGPPRPAAREIVEVIEHRTNRLVGRLLNERGGHRRAGDQRSATTSWCRQARPRRRARQWWWSRSCSSPAHVQPVGGDRGARRIDDRDGDRDRCASSPCARFRGVLAAPRHCEHVQPREFDGRVDLRDVRW